MTLADEERVLVLMPTALDSERTCRLLKPAGIVGSVCGDFAALCQEISRGGGAIMLAEEELAADRHDRLQSVLADQPTWSDFPIIVIAQQGASEKGLHLRESMNATLIERPVKSRSLLSVVKAALRSRRHQYIVRDQLVQRKLIEEALRGKDARLQFALEAGRLGSWELNLLTGELTCSNICKATFGRSGADSFNYADLFEAIHPAEREWVRAAIESAVRDKTDYDVEYRVTWPDGSQHWVLVRGRGIYDSDGIALAMSGVSLDITARKQLEEVLRESDRKKDDFIALLAHELRNPLAPIRNGLEVLRLTGNCADDEPTRSMMERQLGHMVRLIDDLLDVSRISRGKMELKRQAIALGEVFNSAIETARPMIETGGHTLKVDLPAEPIILHGDLTRLSQVFSNLLTNSAKYTPRGGTIWFSAESFSGEVVVSVRDNGIGIPQTSLPSIFEMFSQVDRSIERSTGGLGIGLALVKALVEMHGGTVTATSAGIGSTFTVRLPVSHAALVDSPSESQANGGHRRILVVDDNRDGATSLAEMLRLLGNDVQTANDGLEAVQRAETFHPDVVLMDVGMPVLNGYDAARRIRKEKWGKGMTIIALTGWGQEHDRKESRAAGCNDHLVKPISLAELQQKLSQVAE
jgi:signal transduction histidine kinase/CheY-like chemotaxis protein